MRELPCEVIDIHTHIFKAYALPPQAIMESRFRRFPPSPTWLARPVADLVNALTDPRVEEGELVATLKQESALWEIFAHVPAADAEATEVEGWLDRVAGQIAQRAATILAVRQVETWKASLVSAAADAGFQQLQAAWGQDELAMAVEEIYGLWQQDEGVRKARFLDQLERVGTEKRAVLAREITAIEEREYLVRALVERITGAIKWLLKQLYKLWGTVDGVLDGISFISLFRNRVGEIYSQLESSHSGNSATFVHLMMDMEPACGRAPKKTPRPDYRHGGSGKKK